MRRRKRDREEPASPLGRVGCRSCHLVLEVPSVLEPLRLRLVAFFVDHDEGHDTWIDLAGAPVRLPEAPPPPEQG